MGEHTLTNKFQECPICLIDSVMIELKCGHEICNDCWYNMTLIAENDETKDFIPECPMCRRKN